LTADDMAPEADPDGDGLWNFDEFALGLNPVIPETVEIPELTVENGQPIVRFSFDATVVGVEVILEKSSDSFPWTEVALRGEWVESQGEICEVAVPYDPAAGESYRVRIVEI